MIEVSCSWLPCEEEFSSCLPRLLRCHMETGALPILSNSSLISLLAGAQETKAKPWQWQVTRFSGSQSQAVT